MPLYLAEIYRKLMPRITRGAAPGHYYMAALISRTIFPSNMLRAAVTTAALNAWDVSR